MPYNLGGGSFTGGTLTSALTIPVGAAATPSINVTGDTTTGLYERAAGDLAFSSATAEVVDIGANRVYLTSTGQFGFSSGTLGLGPDTGLARAAAGVVKVANGGAGSGWLQQTAGFGALNANYTNTTATFSNTNLSVTVTSGRTYAFEVVLFLSNSTAAEGAKIDFNGGTATVTNFRVHGILDDTTTTILVSSQATALATAHSIATLTGAGMWKFHGTFVPSGNGTFIVRAAENTTSVGTLTVQRGSYIKMDDMVAL